MKKILFMVAAAFMFASCNKCMECENEWYADGEVNPYQEVCKDNFEDRNAYEDYIEEMEASGWECKSDFWN